MKKYILGLSLVLLILACSKPQEEINNQTIEPICCKKCGRLIEYKTTVNERAYKL